MNRSKKWLNRLHIIIEKYLSDSTLNNQKLANEIETSERNLFRRVKESTGLSPKKYLRQYRLRLAMKHLRDGRYKTVKETSLAVGYISTSYFIQQFEKEFGAKPFKILKEAGWR